MVEWNDCWRAYSEPRLLHGLFEERAAETPDAVAVVSGNGHLTYCRLDRLAERLARRLRSLGVGPEVTVGLCLDGGLDLPLAILAILKAGGAWMPLDPAYPAGRLRFMMRDAEVSVLVTRRRLLRRLDADCARTVCMDAGWQDLPGRGTSHPPAREDSPAYVIYTSGSTGRPKGVAVSHRAVTNRLRWSQEALPLSASDRVLQQASPSFDFSVWELFAAWLAGARVVLVPAEDRRDVERLADLVRDAGITVAHFVPALLAEFLEVAGSVGLGRLRLLYSGGETLQAELRDRALTRLGAELVNQYGPTEAAIDATFWRCRRTDRRPVVPIGRPIANTRVHVLGELLQPVSAGAVGELHIAGEGLARGYVARAARTAASFLPDPWAHEPGRRLYRTGDLARHQSDGSVLLAGRRDHQVQVRGFRIELGEIEAALENHPDLQRAVVLAETGGAAGGGQQLVALPVARAAAPTTAALRDWLQERLPEHMIPTVFLPLSSLPTMPNGKVDRPALGRHARQHLRSGRPISSSAPATYVAPRNPQEEILAEIWSEVLGMAPVGVHDHFLELGGHSLLAARVLSRIRRIFHLDPPLRMLFERPTVAALARGLSTMRRDEAAAAPALEPGPRPAVLPLSFAQERLWFLDQLEPLSPAYNLLGAWRLIGPLDAGVLERALREITRRHEGLRTCLPSTDGKPRQEIAVHPTLRLAKVDLERLAPERRQRQARALAAAEAARPFDLVRGPILRTALLRLDGRDHVLLLVLHHVASDAWSHGILLRELSALYEAFAEGAASPLPELEIQVADVALWQRRWLRDETLATRLAFWRRQLGDRPAALELPTDRPRPAHPSHRGVSHRWTFGEPLTAALEQLGVAAGASLHMTLLAAFTALLHRFTHQRKILVGSPVAGRDREATEGLIGLFVNTLVMRGSLEGEPSFAELLARTREMALAAYGHQELPFEKLVEDLQPERDPSRNPLFQVSLVLHNAPEPEPRLAGLEMRPFETGSSPMARVDLTLYLRQLAGSLCGTMVGARDLFDASTLARFCGCFESLLRGAVADPERRVSALPILARSQRHQLLVEWAEGSESQRRDGGASRQRRADGTACLHHLFEARTSLAPEAVALSFENRQLSYRQLDRRASRLARVLRHDLPRQAVRPRTGTEIVAICLQRGIDMVVAMLAVLKAGSAYLFLDPAHPPARRFHLLADARVRRLLTGRSLAPDFDGWDGEIMRLDSDRPADDGRAAARPPVSMQHPAYLTYTSGSTGRAKGVVSTHQGTAAYLRSILRLQDLGPADTVLQIAPPAFDRSVRDLLAPLVAGSRVVLSAATAEDPETMLLEAAVERVSCLPAMVPSLLRQLVAVTDETPPIANLRLVLFAGESLTGPDCRRARALFGPRVRLVNLYGPTEGTCTASSWTPAAPDAAGGVVAIGRPHPHVSIRLLDRALRTVPTGATGELTLAGAGLAQGYLHRPTATATAFLPDPFATRPGERLYRTGDLGRQRVDGRLEILGRIDHQLKIRGFRIEPAEVEAALAAHPSVRAAVVAGKDVAGDQRLVAWIYPQGESPGAGELRRFLRQSLPDYLVPSIFMPLERLPLTATGKVDRAALVRQPALAPLRIDPAAQANAHDPGTRGPDACNPAEDVLAGIWQELLGIERIGRHDNFFEIGGHSLVATRVVSRIRRAFDVELPLRQLFEGPTIAALARAVAAGRGGAAPPPLMPGTRPSRLPLSFAQERLWFLDRLEPGSSAYNMASAWRFAGRLDAGALGRALHEIGCRHEVLRTRFPALDGQPCQVIDGRSALAMPVVDLARLKPARRQAEAESLAGAAAARPFDLARGPLVRAALLRLGVAEEGSSARSEQHVLLLTIHHIVSDAWSQGNLYRELAGCYQAFSAGERNRPPDALPLQYADFALWQRAWLRGEVLENQLDYWQKQLAGSAPQLTLPTDRPQSTAPTDRGGIVRWRIPRRISHELERLSAGAGATLFMGSLAAFAALLSRYSGQRDVLIGSPVANRGSAELEPLVGLFANTLVLRIDLAPGADDPAGFRGLLQRVRRMALQAYAHQETPFERLVQALRPARSRGSSPLFQVLFALQNVPAEGLELAGLACAPLPTARTRAKFDLSLGLRKTTSALEGELVYKAELFDAPRMRRMARHLTTLIEAVARNPDHSLEHLSLLSEAERHQIVIEWNDTRAERAERRCLHQLFERQAARTPDRVALVYEDQRLTYGQLNDHANQLAGTLDGLGIGRGDVVPVLMHPGLGVPVAYLAIMKSGAAYAPLDLRWPRQRTSRILGALGSSALLVAGGRQTWPWDGALSVDGENVVGSTPDPDLPVVPEDPIYAIYTSGSTGEPKASVNSHGGVANRFSWMDRHYGLADDRVVLQTTHHTFDSSIWQLFWPLLHGARTVIPAQHEGYDLDALIGLADRERVTFTDFVPSVLEVLVQRVEQKPRLERGLAGLRQLIVGGEAINLQAIDRFRSFFPEAGFTNLYGPTETAIGVIFHEIPQRLGEQIPIGRPIDNVAALILDPELNPVPIGVPGEIYLGGACVGLGYLGRPELSARAFIDNPFVEVRGDKLYKTGDLARYRADGNVEFLGRSDDQIKLRGFRVEPAEIEAVLIQHPVVREAAVVVREEPRRNGVPGDRRLAACVVADREYFGSPVSAERLSAAISEREFRAFLERQLPRYMVPSELVFVENLPLTPNGKVDRATLARNGESSACHTFRLEPAAGSQATALMAPRTPVEAQLAAIWSEVLGHNSVGMRDDFFALGGHSLLAVRLMALIERRFQVDLPLSTLFDQPTIEGLARRIAAKEIPNAGSPLVRIRPAVFSAEVRELPPFFCVHPVGGQVLCYRDLAHHLGAEQPFYGLQAHGCDREAILDPGVADMAQRYLQAIRRTQPSGPYRLGGWSMGGTVAFEISRRLYRLGERLDALVLIDTSVPSPRPTDDSGPWFGSFARNLGLAENGTLDLESWPDLGLEDGLRHILIEGRRTNALPSDIDLRRLRALYRLFENNLRAVRSYVPSVYPGKVTLLRASQRPSNGDPTLGWSAFAAGGVAVHTVPGDHYSMLREPHVQVLAEGLAACLADSRRGGGGAGDETETRDRRLFGHRGEARSAVPSGALAGREGRDFDLAEG